MLNHICSFNCKFCLTNLFNPGSCFTRLTWRYYFCSVCDLGFVFAIGHHILIAYTDQEQDRLNKAGWNLIIDFFSL